METEVCRGLQRVTIKCPFDSKHRAPDPGQKRNGAAQWVMGGKRSEVWLRSGGEGGIALIFTVKALCLLGFLGGRKSPQSKRREIVR
jgi:hypothetical protein